MGDYPGAIDYPCDPTNQLGPPCGPKGWVLHTPEEPADGYPGTAYWFAQYHSNPDQRGSTHYFVSYLGFVFQSVLEANAPIANGVIGKPYPTWADPGVSLNRQTLSVEIEGYAASIAQTLSTAQRKALLGLLRYGCAKYDIPVDRVHIIGHYEVATNRSDPGTLDIDRLIADLEDDVTPEELGAAIREVVRQELGEGSEWMGDDPEEPGTPDSYPRWLNRAVRKALTEVPPGGARSGRWTTDV